uniref:Chemokine interleukin-8-like domain-containing protein n=1 Tax=Anas zonorhyncha TaxID=75864 RepID=A0A8B9UL41_9AVES
KRPARGSGRAARMRLLPAALALALLLSRLSLESLLTNKRCKCIKSTAQVISLGLILAIDVTPPGPGRCKNPKAAPLGTRAVLGQTLVPAALQPRRGAGGVFPAGGGAVGKSLGEEAPGGGLSGSGRLAACP